MSFCVALPQYTIQNLFLFQFSLICAYLVVNCVLIGRISAPIVTRSSPTSGYCRMSFHINKKRQGRDRCSKTHSVLDCLRPGPASFLDWVGGGLVVSGLAVARWTCYSVVKDIVSQMAKNAITLVVLSY